MTRARTPSRAALIIATALLGLFLGTQRIAAIDRGAYAGPAGTWVTVTGFVTAVPRQGADGLTRIKLVTHHGRLQAETREPLPPLGIGQEVRATGIVRKPPPWLTDHLRRTGIRRVIAASHLIPTGRRRGGLPGAVDRIRDRAEAALEKAMPPREAALARGMVLGQDDLIDPDTIEDFRRSGLAHLLAVSGQNVMLLATLAIFLAALMGLGLRARLFGVIGLIVLYVPLTGAGPSIQRAAVMGVAGIATTLAGRRRARWYPLLLATLITLAINPLAIGDPGWQLSFAAVAGILLWSPGLRDTFMRRLGPGSWQRGLAEGAAMTIAATIATGPLMAAHFDQASLASLPANLLALPAVAPVMWLGMLTAAAGQLPVIPVEPLNWLNALLIAAIAEIANQLAKPNWATLAIHLSGSATVGVYVVALLVWIAVVRAGPYLKGLRPRVRRSRSLKFAVALALLLVLLGGGPKSTPAIPADLTVRMLDIGQGDAILLSPKGGGAVLVDGGPPGAGLRDALREHGVTRLAAAIVTHPQADHEGGIEDLLGRLPIDTLAYAEAGPDLRRRARAAGVPTRRIGAGDRLRAGRLRLDVLWPQSGQASPAADPNERALVMLAVSGEFEMLLTADAEAEVAPVDPGPIDVLKVAHHGSADAGLPALLSRSSPELALISVGAGNTYGHPTPETLAQLSAAKARVLRTDREGTITLRVRGDRFEVETED